MGGRDESSDISVVGPGTRIEGTVVAAGSLRVEGEVKGKITAEREVTLTPQGRVEANIEATSIVLGGQVKGNLAAKGDVSLPGRQPPRRTHPRPQRGGGRDRQREHRREGEGRPRPTRPGRG